MYRGKQMQILPPYRFRGFFNFTYLDNSTFGGLCVPLNLCLSLQEIITPLNAIKMEIMANQFCFIKGNKPINSASGTNEIGMSTVNKKISRAL